MPIDALNVLCAQLARDLFAIAKFFVPLCNGFLYCLNGDLLPFVFDCLFEVL